MNWATRANETVQVGDLVALSVLKHADAVGRIVAEADDDKVECELVRGGNHASGTFITVERDQLLVKVHE